jgi:hypothetical protein
MSPARSASNSARMAGIEAPVERDEERRAGSLEHLGAGVDASEVEIHRLFAEHALPARAARSMIGACVLGGVQIITAPTAGSANAASRLVVARAPYLPASLSAVAASRSTTRRALLPDGRQYSQRAADR